MKEPSVEALTQRLERVEREIRRWRILGSVALATLVILVLLGATSQKVPEEIRARRFVLEDERGKVLALLGRVTLPHDVFPQLPGKRDLTPALVLFDAEKRVRALLGVDGGGDADLTLYAGKDKSRASLKVFPSGTAAFYLAGRDGIDRAWFEVSGDNPALVFRDASKRQRLVLGGFTLHYQTGVSEVRPTSSLVLVGEEGTVLWKAP